MRVGGFVRKGVTPSDNIECTVHVVDFFIVISWLHNIRHKCKVMKRRDGLNHGTSVGCNTGPQIRLLQTS
jgi:hypothetical protein